MKRLFFSVFAAFLLVSLPFRAADAAVAEQLVDLVKPNGTTLRYLLSTDPAAPAPDTGVMLFPGGQGVVNLARGIPQPGANFLVRTRQLFVRNGLAVAVYDPSPDIGPMSDSARMSQPHADEVAQVLADFRQKTGVKRVYLIGTSRGTVSAAWLATVLKRDVDGVVLTSTLFRSSRAGAGLQGFDFSAISQPLLFVHHVADACKNTAPGFASRMEKTYPVIWVDGAEGSEGDACGPFSRHGYLGRESATVKAIADWVLRRQVAAKVDAPNAPADGMPHAGQSGEESSN